MRIGISLVYFHLVEADIGQTVWLEALYDICAIYSSSILSNQNLMFFFGIWDDQILLLRHVKTSVYLNLSFSTRQWTRGDHIIFPSIISLKPKRKIWIYLHFSLYVYTKPYSVNMWSMSILYHIVILFMI